jgi:hypothetical protein
MGINLLRARSMTVVAGKRRRSAEDGEVQRLNCFISPEAYNRLMINATMERTSPGLYLERLLIDHCKDWAIPVCNKEVKEKKSRRVKADVGEDRRSEVAESTREEIPVSS